MFGTLCPAARGNFYLVRRSTALPSGPASVVEDSRLWCARTREQEEKEQDVDDEIEAERSEYGETETFWRGGGEEGGGDVRSLAAREPGTVILDTVTEP